MADVTTYDGIINGISANQVGTIQFYEYNAAAITAMMGTGTFGTTVKANIASKVLPTPLPGSITKYRPLMATANYQNSGPTQNTFLICKAVNLGSFDVSGASGTFTDGSAMPTRTELGSSVTSYGPILLECTTVCGGTQGVVTITFTDNAGTTSQTTTFTPTNTTGVGAGYILSISGKQGVRDITAVSRSGGSSPTGVIKMWGLLPLGMFTTSVATTGTGYNFLTGDFNFLELGAGDTIKMVSLGLATLAVGSTIGKMWFFGEV